MPQAKLGQQNALDMTTNFLKLTAKDQKIQVRFIKQDYYYEGKHFMKNEDGTWTVDPCPRINENQKCTYCEKYFEIMAPAKELKQAKKDASDVQGKAEVDVQLEQLQQQARPYKANIAFYYPVIDRETKKAKVFQTTLSVRLQLEQLVELGDEVLGTDYIIMRTEKPGSYYTLKAVDSSKTRDLDDEEVKEFTKAMEWDLGDIINGQKSKLSLEGGE